MKRSRITAALVCSTGIAGFAFLVVCSSALAQVRDPAHSLDHNDYSVGETTQTPDTKAENTARFAKIEYVSGKVTWRPDAKSNWSGAHSNIALNPGAQIWSEGDGRAEIKFEDGGVVRIGHGAVAIIDTMFSDKEGAFTRVDLNSGAGFLSLKSSRSVYQIDMPTATVIASGNARVRVEAIQGSNIGVRQGKAVVNGKGAKQQKVEMKAGDFVDVPTAEAAISIKRIPRPDGWDRWNDERDGLTGYGYRRPAIYGPSIYVPVFIPFGGGFHHRW